MLKLLIVFIFCVFLGTFLWILFDSLYYFFKSPKKYADPVVYKPNSFLHNLLVEFPRTLGTDRANFNRDVFNDTGFILYEGKQGAGKTYAMTHHLNLLKAKYPQCYIITNYNVMFQNGELNHWTNIIGKKNGELGFIAAFDEISIWFNNRNFKNFDPAFFGTIVQNRKQKRLILGTAQNISLVDKALRTQVTELRQCSCFFGCVILVRRFFPVFDSEGNIKEFKKPFKRRFYFIFQNEFERNLYDTYEVINKMREIGYEDN